MCEINDCYLVEIGYWINKDKSMFKRNEIVPKSLTNLVRLKRNNEGVFKTAYSYNVPVINEAYLYGDFYLDFDSQDFEEVREDVIMAISYLKIVFKINHEDVNIYFSGNKGMHIVVPAKLLGIEPDKKLNETFKTIAISISEFTKNKTLDLRIYDNKRLFRIENSIHESTKKYKVYLTFEEVKELNLDDIKNIASAPRDVPFKDIKFSNNSHKMYEIFKERATKELSKITNVRSSGNLKYTPPCIVEIIDSGATMGKRNNTLAILASYYKATGKDLTDTIDELKEWNEEKNTPPIATSELIKTCKSIYLKDNQFGCTSIKLLDLCSNEKCSFRK